MTALILLPGQMRLALVCFLFLAMCAELGYGLFLFYYGERKGRCIAEGVFFLVLLFLLSLLSMREQDFAEQTCLSQLPWMTVAVLALGIFLHAVRGMVRIVRNRDERLSAYAVKEALDNLESGILFADEKGRIILINGVMDRLLSGVMGASPQMLYEVSEVLEGLREFSPKEDAGLSRAREEESRESPEVLEGLREFSPKEDAGLSRAGEKGTGKSLGTEERSGIYEFPGDRIWRFSTLPLQSPELLGFSQTTAQNVTESLSYNRRLREENEALQITNRKLKEMYERLTFHIREQETLNLRIRLHNDIGTSLLSIWDLMEKGQGENFDENLSVLQNAISYLGEDSYQNITGDMAQETMESAFQQAENMHVRLVMEGRIPGGAGVEEILALTAKECITNCAKHAGGNEVRGRVNVYEADKARGANGFREIRDGTGTISPNVGMKVLQAVFENNGKPPKERIIEGGGLLAIRKKIEDFGGSMEVISEPGFSLRLSLPIRED
ncbi:MAG: hypothetical protein K5989_01705 [Lachnospiraceae bacterium]|nr:hypothetical protein [Lachnospiraceae bacterium]